MIRGLEYWVIMALIVFITIYIVLWWAVGVVLEMVLHRPPSFWEQLAVYIILVYIGIRIKIGVGIKVGGES